MLIGNLVITV